MARFFTCSRGHSQPFYISQINHSKTDKTGAEMALRITIKDMHFQLCPLRESQDEDAFADNSDCEDCALIAAAYSQGYEEGWVDAGEQAMNTITDRMAQAASEMYDVLLMEEIPAEKFGRVQVFR